MCIASLAHILLEVSTFFMIPPRSSLNETVVRQSIREMFRSRLEDMAEDMVRRRAEAPTTTSSEPGRPSDVMHEDVSTAPTSSLSIISSYSEHVTATTTATNAQPTEPKTTETQAVPEALPTDSHDKTEPVAGLQPQGKQGPPQRRPRKKINMPPNVAADRQRMKDLLRSPHHHQQHHHQQQEQQQHHLPQQSSFAEWSRHWGPQRAFKVPPHGHCLDEQHAWHHNHRHHHFSTGLGPCAVVIVCVVLLWFLVGPCIPWLTEHGRRRRGAVRLREDGELWEEEEAGESSRTPLMATGGGFDETELEEFVI